MTQPPRPWTAAERKIIWERWKQGDTVTDIARALDRYDSRIFELLSKTGGIEPASCVRSARSLSMAEREEISRGIAANLSVRSIARSLGRSASSVSREIIRNGGATCYRATDAESQATARARRPKRCRLRMNRRLARKVARKLRLRWSPEQISSWLKKTHPCDPDMTISHETIYRTLYVQTRGALKKELQSFLRRRHVMRQARQRNKPALLGHIPDMVLISERSPEVEDRAVPGHWEGDLVFGKNNSQIVTLVERHSRYVTLLKIDSRDTVSVVTALTEHACRLPKGLMSSLTWDRGKELAQHLVFTMATDVQVYFCDPKSPWQRGSNENTNGLLRQYLPKTMDLCTVTQKQLDAIARELNMRPRKTLGYETPADTLRRAVASTG